MPFFEVAYGHVVRYSKATDERDASFDAFGVFSRTTVLKLSGNPKYMTMTAKRAAQRTLAIKHFRATGNILSGWETIPGIRNVHWTACVQCMKPILTEPKSKGEDNVICKECQNDPVSRDADQPDESGDEHEQSHIHRSSLHEEGSVRSGE